MGKRGPRPTYASSAERQKAYRERQKEKAVTLREAQQLVTLQETQEWSVDVELGLQSRQLIGGLTEMQATMLIASLKDVVKRGTRLSKRQIGAPLLLTSL